MLRVLIYALLFSLTFGSCRPEPNQILAKHKVLIDTLVLRETKILRPKLDSICNADFDKMVSTAADSILQIRIRNIEAIKGN